MAHFLQIVQRDRSYEADAGRKALLQCFQILGDSGECVSRFRRELALLLKLINPDIYLFLIKIGIVLHSFPPFHPLDCSVKSARL